MISCWFTHCAATDDRAGELARLFHFMIDTISFWRTTGECKEQSRLSSREIALVHKKNGKLSSQVKPDFLCRSSFEIQTPLHFAAAPVPLIISPVLQQRASSMQTRFFGNDSLAAGHLVVKPRR